MISLEVHLDWQTPDYTSGEQWLKGCDNKDDDNSLHVNNINDIIQIIINVWQTHMIKWQQVSPMLQHSVQYSLQLGYDFSHQNYLVPYIGD